MSTACTYRVEWGDHEPGAIGPPLYLAIAYLASTEQVRKVPMLLLVWLGNATFNNALGIKDVIEPLLNEAV